MLNFYRLPQDYIRFEGNDRLDLINRLSTNEVNSLSSNHFIKTILTSDKGRFVDLLSLYNFQDFVLASCSLNNAARVLAHLDRYTIMDDFKPADMTGKYETILIFGDNLNEFARSVFGADVTSLDNNEVTVINEERTSLLHKNDDALGGLLSIYSASEKEIWEDLIFAPGNNEKFRMNEFTDTTYETRRIELGIPVFGKEMTDHTNPLECGLSKYVSFTKGCYIGQEVIARLDAYDKISKQMTGIRCKERIPEGDVKITLEDKECGFLTSRTESEKYGNIGIGFVKTIFLDFNKSYKLKSSEKTTECTISRLPFETA